MIETIMDENKFFVVFNPLTKECIQLPAVPTHDAGFSSWNYATIRVHMMVDNATNSYKLIIIDIQKACV